MKSQNHGRNISKAEVQDISKHGIWLLVNGKEYLLPFSEYPWFKDAKVADIHELEFLHGVHLHWPKLDVDLEVSSLEFPEKYPLIYKLA